MSGYSVLISTIPSHRRVVGDVVLGQAARARTTGTSVVRRPSRMTREKVCDSSLSRRLSSRSRSRVSSSRSTPERRKSRSASLEHPRRASPPAARRPARTAGRRPRVEMQVGAERACLDLEAPRRPPSPAASGCTTLISELTAKTSPSAMPASFQSCRIGLVAGRASLSAATSAPALDRPCRARSVTQPSQSSSRVGSSSGCRSGRLHARDTSAARTSYAQAP